MFNQETMTGTAGGVVARCVENRYLTVKRTVEDEIARTQRVCRLVGITMN